MFKTHHTRPWAMLAQYISFQHVDFLLLLRGIMLNSTRRVSNFNFFFKDIQSTNQSGRPTSWESSYKIVYKRLPHSSSEHMAPFQEILIAFFKYNCAKQLHQ